eukprot:g4358.t1
MRRALESPKLKQEREKVQELQRQHKKLMDRAANLARNTVDKESARVEKAKLRLALAHAEVKLRKSADEQSKNLRELRENVAKSLAQSRARLLQTQNRFDIDKEFFVAGATALDGALGEGFTDIEVENATKTYRKLQASLRTESQVQQAALQTLVSTISNMQGNHEKMLHELQQSGKTVFENALLANVQEKLYEKLDADDNLPPPPLEDSPQPEQAAGTHMVRKVKISEDGLKMSSLRFGTYTDPRHRRKRNQLIHRPGMSGQGKWKQMRLQNGITVSVDLVCRFCGHDSTIKEDYRRLRCDMCDRPLVRRNFRGSDASIGGDRRSKQRLKKRLRYVKEERPWWMKDAGEVPLKSL